MQYLQKQLVSFFIILIVPVIGGGPLSADSSVTPETHTTVILEFHPTVNSTKRLTQSISQEFNGHVLHTFDVVFDGCAMKVPHKDLQRIERHPRIRNVNMNRTYHLVKPVSSPHRNSDKKMIPWPGDDDEEQQQKTPLGIKEVNADDVSRSHPHKDINVAVADTGIDQDHPDLKSNVSGGFSTVSEDENDWNDPHGHGTHVAGTIAAVDNQRGVIGVAPRSDLFGVQVIDASGQGTTAEIIEGIDWIAQSRRKPNRSPIHVVNMSLGGPAPDGKDPMHKAIKSAEKMGITFVVAAGNNNRNVKNSTPARYKEVITVSAIDARTDSFAYFSNYGEGVQVTAPGVNVRSTFKEGKYKSLNGTSMASPHVAGAAALALGQNQKLTPEEVQKLLVDEGDPIELPEDPDDHDEPLLNAQEAAKGLNRSLSESLE